MHFIPVNADSIPGGFAGPFGKLLKSFLPVELRSEDYPNLIPPGESVPTVASGVVLAAYAWPENTERYNRVAKFVHAFFNSLDQLKDKKRHPKWAQINLAAEASAANSTTNLKRQASITRSSVSFSPTIRRRPVVLVPRR
jgi:hypothetical protein